MKKTQYSDSAVTSSAWYNFVRTVHLKNLSEKTKKDYLRWIRQLDYFYPDNTTAKIGPTKVLDFLVHLQQERRLEGSSVNQALCAIRLFYRDHLGRDWDIWQKIKIHRSEPLPHVLSREEVAPHPPSLIRRLRPPAHPCGHVAFAPVQNASSPSVFFRNSSATKTFAASVLPHVAP